jgi:putative membrane protein
MRRRPVLWVAVVLLGIFVYDAVLRSLVAAVVVLPSVPGGLKVLTAILALFSLTHAWYSLGGRLTLAFFGLSAAIAWAYEQAGVLTGLVYGAYHYTDYLGGKLGEVPLLIPLAWFMMIYPSYIVANLAIEGRPLGTPPGTVRLVRLAAASAIVMTVWDLVIDPILSGPSVKAWIWETGGPYFGIPIQNYAGWLLTTFTVFLAYRYVEQRWTRAAPAERGGGIPIPAWAAAAPARAAALPLTRAAAALPLAAYGLMLVADLTSGVAPAGLVVIGPAVMGVPLALAAWRLASPAGGRGRESAA